MKKRHNFKSLISLVLTICVMLSSVIGTTAVFADEMISAAAAEDAIALVIDGQVKNLTHSIEVDENGVVFVPMVETFGYLGVEMSQMADGTYKGFGNNGEIIIDLTKDTAEIDWVDLELPGAPYLSGGTVMVPAYLIEDAVKTEPAVFDAEARVLLVASPDPDDEYYGGADIGEIIKTLPGGKVVINHEDVMNDGGGGSGLTVQKNVSVDVDGPKSALQIATGSKKTATYYYAAEGKQDFTKDDVGVIHFKARATAIGEEDMAATLRIMYERYSDWSKIAINDFDIKLDQWEDFYLPFNARVLGTDVSADWAANNSQICFGVMGLSQTIQIVDFEVIYFGKNITIDQLQPDYGSYHGIEEDALWRKEAYRRIEKYRKDDVAVSVVDEAGNPVEGVEIKVNQTESDFVFGTELCYDEIIDIDPNTVRAMALRNALNSFNALVCGLEMKPYKQVLYDATRGVEMANDIFGRNMRLRGHTVMWDGNTILDFLSETGNYQDLSYEELYRRIMDFVTTNAYLFKGKTFQWDVLNEPYESNHIRKTFDTTRLYTDITKLVRSIDPDTKLIVNEGHMIGKNKGGIDIVPGLKKIVKQMQDEGAYVDGIGIQAHVNQYYYPQGLYRQLDELSETVDEVAITEYDFIHDSQENAGKYLGDLLTAAFSHPKCNTFMIWSLSTYDDKNLGVFFDRNWNEKPAKAVWDDFVNNKFKTRISLVSDSEGRADFRGFHGEYTIAVKYNGKEKTFDFGLLKDEENTIEITVGNRISANVSSGKYIEIPDGVDYASFSEAEDAYREQVGNMAYNSLVLEKNLSSVIGSSSKLLNGGTLSSSSKYKSGKIWGSASGISAVASNDPDGQGIIFKNSAEGTFDLSHIYSGNVFNEGNMEVSAIVKTADSRTEGFALAMGFLENGEAVHLGEIKTSAEGYFVETLGGEEIELNDNTTYDVKFTLMQTDFPGVYDVKYTVEENCKTVVDEVVEEQSLIDSIVALGGIAFDVTANGAENDAVLNVEQARAKFYTYNVPVTYQDADGSAEVAYDALRHYNTADIVSLTDPAYLNGDSWGAENPETAEDYFAYETHSDHLYSVRTAPAGEQTLKKNLGALKTGEGIEVDFDFYMDSPRVWYNSEGKVDVRLESADGAISRSLVKERYSARIGFYVDLFAGIDGEYAASKKVEYTDSVTGIGDYNRNNLHINLKLVPNANGNYDATMNVTNETGTVNISETVADYLTADEFLKINNFVFAGETVVAGSNYGKGIAGIKNVKVTKNGSLIKDGENIVLAEGDTVGIKFSNPLARPFDAQLVLVRYADEKFSSMKIIDFNGRRDAEGYLSIRVDKEKEDENRFMVMLLDGNNALKPLKKAEMIVISE